MGETQTIEFKKSLSLQKEALETLCGMINTDDGRGGVLFGIEPDGRICGVEPGNLDKAQISLVNHIRQKIQPPIVCNVEILEFEEKHLILLRAERTSEIVYHEYDGRAFIRVGSSTRQLSFEEKQRYSMRRNRDKHNGPWKCSQCNSWVGVLISMDMKDGAVKKSYKCPCGGEFWPI